MTGVKKRSMGQEMLSVSVKLSRTILRLGETAKMKFRMVKILWPLASRIRNNVLPNVQKWINQLE